MLSRFLLIVSVLLACMEDVPANIRRRDPWPNHMAPVNIRSHDSGPTYPRFFLDGIVPLNISWNEFIIYVMVLPITMFLLGIFIGFIYDIIWRHLTRDESGRDDGSDDRATTAPLGNHKAPHGPLAEKRDKLKNIRIPSGPVRDLVAKFQSHQNTIVNSDRNHENKLNIGNDESPGGPLAEKSDKLKNIRIPPSRVSDLVAKFQSHQNVIVNSDRKHENKLNIGNDESPRGPWAEKSDELKNIRIPPSRVSDLVAKFNSYQNASVNSDKHQEDKKHVPPSLLIFLKASERPTGFSEDEARPSQNRQ
ncbi:uncharacterized protein LOC143809158 isoform X1 [Ranitomeya variabilis]|uniref:uncharacterized protein LOC143809158 isoform X1 n=1 Tax=Ranitomeya variabilis TaxID=490064 RepID=UPI004056B5FA